jgi:predicted phage gp36 major capsid-like protein
MIRIILAAEDDVSREGEALKKEKDRLRQQVETTPEGNKGRKLDLKQQQLNVDKKKLALDKKKQTRKAESLPKPQGKGKAESAKVQLGAVRRLKHR